MPCHKEDCKRIPGFDGIGGYHSVEIEAPWPDRVSRILYNPKTKVFVLSLYAGLSWPEKRKTLPELLVQRNNLLKQFEENPQTAQHPLRLLHRGQSDKTIPPVQEAAI